MFESTRDQATAYLKGKGYALTNANVNRMIDYLEATQEREAPAWIREHGALTAGFEKEDPQTKSEVSGKRASDGPSESDRRQNYEFVRGKPKPDIPDRERRPETKADADRPRSTKPYKGEPPAVRPPGREAPNTSKAIPDDAPPTPTADAAPATYDDDKWAFLNPLMAAGGAAAVPFMGPKDGGSPAMAALVPPPNQPPPMAGAAAAPVPTSPADVATAALGGGGGGAPVPPGPPQLPPPAASNAPQLPPPTEQPMPMVGDIIPPGQATPANVADMVMAGSGTGGPTTPSLAEMIMSGGPGAAPSGPMGAEAQAAMQPPSPTPNLPATTAQPQSPMDMYREDVGQQWTQSRDAVAMMPKMTTGNPAVPIVHVDKDGHLYDARTLEPIMDPALEAAMRPRIQRMMFLKQYNPMLKALGGIAR